MPTLIMIWLLVIVLGSLGAHSGNGPLLLFAFLLLYVGGQRRRRYRSRLYRRRYRGY